MESDEDFELLPSSPVQEQRKLKRLKKVIRASEYSPPSTSPTNFPELANGGQLEESNGESSPELEDTSKGVTVNEDDLGATRVLEFDSVGEELDGKVTEEKGEVGDLNTNELEGKRRRLDFSSENNEKKKKRIDDGDGSKESISNKRKTEKERRENLKRLRADSQRLLRETRDAAFKPIPLVQKPISSILDKIRQRKLEIVKKSSASFDDNDGYFVGDGSEHACPIEEIIDKVKKAEPEETPPTFPAATTSNLDKSHFGGSNDAADDSSCKSIPSAVDMGSESEHAFRAPIGDTQELFSASQRGDTEDEDVNEKPNNPSEEVFVSSMLAMNLKLDSAPPDDDVFSATDYSSHETGDNVASATMKLALLLRCYFGSSDDEDNGKENIDPHIHGSVDLTLPSSGDPVKAFVDEEAEEEDDSDNDLQHFKDEEEGEDDDDIEELNDMIATAYEEKPVDREKRDQLHQQWLEQQDTAGMDNLLQKLNCGSKLKETSIEEGDEEIIETENESDDEAEEYIAPSEAVKINLKKVKQMIPQMFTDKDDAYISSDDEETEERLAKQCHFYKVEEKATFVSPAEDESSREVFSLIKKLNIVPETKRKGRTPAFFDMPLIGQNINISSKSSFVGRASNRFMPSSKRASSKVRSFIFERDDSNSRTSVLMSEDSSDMIQKESQPPKVVSAKFQRNTQNKYTTLNSTPQKPGVSLLEILRRSSIDAEHSVQNAEVQQRESVFDAFKLAKTPTKTETRI
ncbi:uncharacterized protein LOC133313334 [Gastrolobium bilobum]|uniref:uncharacterized protein LOC133313334 n=1 Tax=Gastrolobium bilobum TaxID=150636 RepID=UPI002AB24FEF|nr:uncharacterized protein LOC133313334 [Gastrolobium bilobum]